MAAATSPAPLTRPSPAAHRPVFNHQFGYLSAAEVISPSASSPPMSLPKPPSLHPENVSLTDVTFRYLAPGRPAGFRGSAIVAPISAVPIRGWPTTAPRINGQIRE